MKTLLVTGSAGFIGFHVTKALLEQGEQVVGIDNLNDYYDVELKHARNAQLLKMPNYVFIEGDISQEKTVDNLFSKYSFDKICHLAAQAGVRFSLEKPFLYEKTNVLGTLHIFEYARRNNCPPIVFASSSSVYGNEKMPSKGFVESKKLSKPISLYAATKLSNEQMAFTYHHLYGLKSIGLRFFTVYGPWGRPDMAYFDFTRRLFDSQIIPLNNHGNMYRDFTYIDDIVSGILNALQCEYEFEIINLGNSKPEKLREFLTYLETYTGKSATIKNCEIPPGDMLKTYANTAKAAELLGWAPTVNIEKGLRDFVEWYISYYSK